MRILKVKIFEDNNMERMNENIEEFLSENKITENDLIKTEMRASANSSSSYVSFSISYWSKIKDES